MNKTLKNALLGTVFASTLLAGNSVLAAEVTVKSGDTLYSFSRTYQVPVEEIKTANQLTSNSLYIGQVLKIPETNPAQTVSAPPSTYTVVKGDTLWSISTKTKVSVDNLKTWNQLSSNTVYIGQVLQLSNTPATQPTEPTPAPAKPEESSSAQPVAQTEYTVKSGDYLYKIATQFKVTVTQLREWNQLKSDTLSVGQVLKVSSPDAFHVNQLLAEAKKYMGVPYVWGGSTPSGFDCSGYLNYVFKNVGLSIPRTVVTIWDVGVSVAQPKIGDLVFFETYKPGPSHAGIYLGNGEFIHASSSQGVTITKLSNSYWSARYLGAKSYF